MPYTSVTEGLIDKFMHCLEQLYIFDHLLIRFKVSERCLCHCLAVHMSKARPFKNYNCDVEYNRDLTQYDEIGDMIKRIGENGDPITSDLLCHKRRGKNNLLCLEMKTYYNSDRGTIASDKERLREMTLSSGAFRYKLGVFVDVLRDNTLEIVFYIDGNEYPYSGLYEDYHITLSNQR